MAEISRYLGGRKTGPELAKKSSAEWVAEAKTLVGVEKITGWRECQKIWGRMLEFPK